MKFGIFDHIDDAGVPLGQLYAERLTIAEAYDRSGFHAYHVAEHHTTPLGAAASPALIFAALSQRTTRLRFGPLVYLLPFYHPLRLIEEVCMLDQMSGGRFQLGVGRGVSMYETAAYGLDFGQTQAMYHEAFQVLLKGLGSAELSFAGEFYRFDRQPMILRPLQRPHPPLWSACGSDETARQTGSLGMGGLFGGEGGPARVEQLMALYRDALRDAPVNAAGPTRRAALMTAGYCHEDKRVVADRGTELVGWYIEQQRERARLVWRDYDPTNVPPDYQGYYARDQRLAAGPHPGEPTPQQVCERGEQFCVGTPADCIRFIEMYEALGIEEMILLCAIGPAQHEEVMHTLRLFGEQVIPHFRAKGARAAAN